MKTDNPIALRTLMSETIFAAGDVSDSPQKNEDKQADMEAGLVAVPPSSKTGGEEEKQDDPPEIPRETFVYQGDKSSGILFVLRTADHPYFSPRAEDAFAKAIGAAGLAREKVAVVNLANADNPNDFGQLMAFFQPKKIALLGVDPASLKLPAIPQNAHKKGKKAVVFHTFGFEEMLDDANRKKAFWTAFKTFMAV